MKWTHYLISTAGIPLVSSCEHHRNSGRAKAPNARLCVIVSLWLLLGQTLSLGSICLAKPIPHQVKPSRIQTEQIPVAVLSFQDESGNGASDEFCLRLGEHLMKRLYVVSNQTISPKSVRAKPGVEWTQQRLSALGKSMGARFVVHSGLLAVSSDGAGGKVTSRAQVYADVLSVEGAVMKRLESEGVGSQRVGDSEAAVQLGSADFRSREFLNTSVGQALSNAIEQLAALIYPEIGSGGVAPYQKSRRPVPADTAPDNPPQDPTNVPIEGDRDDPGATGEAQEAQADEELQQLIAQAQECLNGLNAVKDKDKINALIEALKGLTSALETKAGLLEQGNITGADQVDEQIDAQEQELQDAVDQSLPQDQPGDVSPSDVDPGSGASKFDQVVKYVDFGFSVLEKILDLRARFRGITQDPTLAASYSSDPGQGDGDTSSEETLETISGNVSEDAGATQGSLTVEKQGLSLAMLEAPDNPRGPNAADSYLNPSMESGASNAGAATTGRRRPVAGAEVIEPDSGASALTDNSGFFTLRVPARSTKLIVRKGGAKVADVAIHVVRGRPSVADIQLGRSGRGATMQAARVLPSSVVVNSEDRNTGTIRGVIQDAKGQPVPRALVDVQGLAIARTDSQGRFSFAKVPAGLQRLTVRASDSLPSVKQVRITANEITQSTIQLNPDAGIRGTGGSLIVRGAGTVFRGVIQDNQNRPVAGAKISAVSASGSTSTVSVRTRTDGSYELRDLKPGSYRVLVDKFGYAAESRTASLQAGRTDPLNFRLKKDATSPFRPGVEEGLARDLVEVRGQVRGRNGAPIPNAWVELKRTGKTSSTNPQRTNARGEYLLKALPGRYELSVRSKDHQEASRAVTVQARDPRRENFELNTRPGRGGGEGRSFASGTLSGRVTDKNTHAPISGAIVSVTGRNATTDRAGNYSIGSVPTGRQQVDVARSGYADEARTIDVRAGGSTSVSFDLRPRGGGNPGHPNATGQLRGRVTDGMTRRPISGARVSIPGHESDTTDSGGNYTITNLRAGKYPVVVTQSRYLSATENVEIKSGSSTNRNFDLKPAGTGNRDSSTSGNRNSRSTKLPRRVRN